MTTPEAQQSWTIKPTTLKARPTCCRDVFAYDDCKHKPRNSVAHPQTDGHLPTPTPPVICGDAAGGASRSALARSNWVESIRAVITAPIAEPVDSCQGSCARSGGSFARAGALMRGVQAVIWLGSAAGLNPVRLAQCRASVD